MNFIVVILLLFFLYTFWYVYVVHGPEGIKKIGLPLYLITIVIHLLFLFLVVYFVTIEIDNFVILIAILIAIIANFLYFALFLKEKM